MLEVVFYVRGGILSRAQVRVQGGLGALSPAGSMGRAPGGGLRGKAPEHLCFF